MKILEPFNFNKGENYEAEILVTVTDLYLIHIAYKYTFYTLGYAFCSILYLLSLFEIPLQVKFGG